MTKIVCVSGGFDPLHFAHVKHMEEAAKYGELIVVLNSDEWLERKKGYIFMPFEERKFIIERLKCVSQVTSVEDSDGTICEALRRIRPTFYAKGGDRIQTNTPELQVCEDYGITAVFGVGGYEKPQSSSWLVQRAAKHFNNKTEILEKIHVS